MIVIQIIVNTHDHRRRATAMASPGLRQNVHMPTTSLRITTSPYLNNNVSVCTALQQTETCTWYETRFFLSKICCPRYPIPRSRTGRSVPMHRRNEMGSNSDAGTVGTRSPWRIRKHPAVGSSEQALDESFRVFTTFDICGLSRTYWSAGHTLSQ